MFFIIVLTLKKWHVKIVRYKVLTNQFMKLKNSLLTRHCENACRGIPSWRFQCDSKRQPDIKSQNRVFSMKITSTGWKNHIKRRRKMSMSENKQISALNWTSIRNFCNFERANCTLLRGPAIEGQTNLTDEHELRGLSGNLYSITSANCTVLVYNFEKLTLFSELLFWWYQCLWIEFFLLVKKIYFIFEP